MKPHVTIQTVPTTARAWMATPATTVKLVGFNVIMVFCTLYEKYIVILGLPKQIPYMYKAYLVTLFT